MVSSMLCIFYHKKCYKTVRLYKIRYVVWGRSQDNGGIGRQDHFLPYKFMERTIRRANFTKQLLIAS